MKFIRILSLTILFLSLTNANAEPAESRKDIDLSYAVMDGVHVLSNGVIIGAGGFQSDQLLYIRQDGVTYDYIKGFEGPIDLTQVPDGSIFVTNFNNATVSKINTDGTLVKFADVFEGPAGITSDQQGNLYVSHYGSFSGDGDSVLKITPDGEVSVYSSGGLLSAPIGITMGEQNMLYVANFNNGLVLQINPDGSQAIIAEIPSEVGFAIGHIEYVDGKLFLSNPAGGMVYAMKIGTDSVGPLRGLKASKKLTYPNGLTHNPVTNSIIVAEVQQSSKLVSVSVEKPLFKSNSKD